MATAKALGAWQDGPTGLPQGRHRRPCALPAREALALLREDALVVAVAAGNLAHGASLREADLQRLLACVARIQRIADEVGVAAPW